MSTPGEFLKSDADIKLGDLIVLRNGSKSAALTCGGQPLRLKLIAGLREIVKAKDRELERLHAFEFDRHSAESGLSLGGYKPTIAEMYVLTPNAESLVGVVGEQYEKLGDAIFGVNATDSSLLVHDPARGYVSAYDLNLVGG